RPGHPQSGRGGHGRSGHQNARRQTPLNKSNVKYQSSKFEIKVKAEVEECHSERSEESRRSFALLRMTP
ncbi:MAG: hypothetical protein MUP18_01210, partial [Desulfobacterales bacterium]|nr:hypothetical protein [Desulfobacterales bacterium]